MLLLKRFGRDEDPLPFTVGASREAGDFAEFCKAGTAHIGVGCDCRTDALCKDGVYLLVLEGELE
jgi:hypothetical protein